MNLIQKIEYRRRLKWLVKETVKVLGIPKGEAEKRVLRLAGMEWLKETFAEDSDEYRIAGDIIMQIPSSKPVTVEAMKEIVNEKLNKPK